MDIFPTPPDSRPISDRIYQLFEDYRYIWDLKVREDNGAFKTNLPWWIFVLGAVMVIFIALTTVMFQSVKAALKNPTEALRYE